MSVNNFLFTDFTGQSWAPMVLTGLFKGLNLLSADKDLVRVKHDL